MNLKYKILWIENEEDWVDSIEDQIQEYLDNLGFEFKKKLISKEDQEIDYNSWDLILMDLNLASQPNGAELISKIRNQGVYTDVVFYSSSGIDELRTKGREKELDGVYYSSRDVNLFIKKVKAVIDTTIKKVQDLNNLRGLVMAEVSELDSRMASLIKKYFIDQSTDKKTKDFTERFVNEMEKNTKKKLSKSKTCDKLCKYIWRNLSIDKIIEDFDFDASRKARAVNLIIKEAKISYTPKGNNFFEDYSNEMLKMRNQLAHCSSSYINGKEILTTKDGEKEFNDEKFKEIRKQIREYNAIFDKIEKKI